MSPDSDMRFIAILIVVGLIGGGTLIGVFKKMKEGFGPYNLKVVGIVLVATLAALLAILPSGNSTSAAMGVLGAIAGYLFGLKSE